MQRRAKPVGRKMAGVTGYDDDDDDAECGCRCPLFPVRRPLLYHAVSDTYLVVERCTAERSTILTMDIRKTTAIYHYHVHHHHHHRLEQRQQLQLYRSDAARASSR